VPLVAGRRGPRSGAGCRRTPCRRPSVLDGSRRPDHLGLLERRVRHAVDQCQAPTGGRQDPRTAVGIEAPGARSGCRPWQAPGCRLDWHTDSPPPPPPCLSGATIWLHAFSCPWPCALDPVTTSILLCQVGRHPRSTRSPSRRASLVHAEADYAGTGRSPHIS